MLLLVLLIRSWFLTHGGSDHFRVCVRRILRDFTHLSTGSKLFQLRDIGRGRGAIRMDSSADCRSAQALVLSKLSESLADGGNDSTFEHLGGIADIPERR
jgi:hypothetical protein